MHMLRFATFLSPLLFPTYAAIVEYLGRAVGIPVELTTESSVDDLAHGAIDGAFLCGRQYVELVDRHPGIVTLLGAPVLRGKRYRSKPNYFADLVVRADRPYKTLEDVRGAALAFNEPASHSGYSLVRATLLKNGQDLDHFGTLQPTGSHLTSLDWVLAGRADVAPIDSHVLDVALQRTPSLARSVRVIASFGPSPIPPIIISTQLSASLREALQGALTGMDQDSDQRQRLQQGRIRQFVPVTDADYHPLRNMLALCAQADGMAAQNDPAYAANAIGQRQRQTKHDQFLARAEQAVIEAFAAWHQHPSSQAHQHIEHVALRLLAGCTDYAEFRSRYQRLLSSWGQFVPWPSFFGRR